MLASKSINSEQPLIPNELEALKALGQIIDYLLVHLMVTFYSVPTASD